MCYPTEIKANFHFSHYKSMETLSCLSNRCIYAKAKKKQEKKTTTNN